MGLAGNLSTVMCTAFIIMKPPLSLVAIAIVFYTGWLIYSNALRIQKKFVLLETVHLDDLTSFPNSIGNLVPVPYRGKSPQEVV